MTAEEVKKFKVEVLGWSVATQRQFYYLDEAVKEGKAVGMTKVFGKEYESLYKARTIPEVREFWDPWMQSRSTKIAAQVQRKLRPYLATRGEGAFRVLDWCGSTGYTSMKLAEMIPQAQMTVLDLDHVCAQTDQIVKQAGLESRVKTLACDLMDSNFKLEEEYDAVMMIHTIREWSAESVLKFFKAVYNSLTLGGHLVLNMAEKRESETDFSSNDDMMRDPRISPTMCNGYGLYFLCCASHGENHMSHSKLRELLIEAGFGDITMDGPYLPDLVVAVKKDTTAQSLLTTVKNVPEPVQPVSVPTAADTIVTIAYPVSTAPAAQRFRMDTHPELFGFTISTPSVDCEHRTIQQLSKQLIPPQTTMKEAAIIVRDWVAQNIVYSFEPLTDTASTTLRKRAGMCGNKANLQIALLRAAKIPAGFVVTYINGALLNQSAGTDRIAKKTHHIFCATYLDESNDFHYYDATFPYGIDIDGFSMKVDAKTGGSMIREDFITSPFGPVQADVSHIMLRNDGGNINSMKELSTELNKNLRETYLKNLPSMEDMKTYLQGVMSNLKPEHYMPLCNEWNENNSQSLKKLEIEDSDEAYAVHNVKRIYSISDIHVDHKENLEWVDTLPQHCHDALIVAGDICSDLPLMKKTLEGLKNKFKVVFFVPGNHDLWVNKKESGDSFNKANEIEKMCNDLGVVCNKPVLVKESGDKKKGVWIVPMWSWYDESLDLQNEVSDLYPEGSTKFDQFGFQDFLSCRWPSELRNNGIKTVTGTKTYPSDVSKVFAGRNQKTIEFVNAALKKGVGSSVISFSHFLPNKQCLMDWKDPQTADFDLSWLNHRETNEEKFKGINFSKVAGSKILEKQIRQLNNYTNIKHTHIFGHSHRVKDFEFENVRYIQHCLGTPDEQKKKIVPTPPHLFLAYNCANHDSGDAFIDPTTCPTTTPTGNTAFPVMYKPALWKGYYTVTKDDTMKMIEKNFATHLRGYTAEPTKAVATARHITLDTMSVDTRYLTRPVDTFEMRCVSSDPNLCEHSQTNHKTVQLRPSGIQLEDVYTVLKKATQVYGGIWFDLDGVRDESGIKKTKGDASFVPCDVIKHGDCLILTVDEKRTPFTYDDGCYNISEKNTEEFKPKEKANPAKTFLELMELCVGCEKQTIYLSGAPALTQNTSAETQMHLHLCTSLDALVGYSNQYVGSDKEFYNGDYDNYSNKNYRGLIHEALESAKLSAYDIDFLVVTQHSPGPFPGVAAHLLSLPDSSTESGLMFRPDCKQYFLPASAGCAGGTISMGLVRDMLRANPNKNALLVNIELSSLGFRPKRGGMSWLLNAGLFGDGIAATAFRGPQTALRLQEKQQMRTQQKVMGLEMVESIQRTVPNTSHVSGFTWDAEGYHFVTTQELCTVVSKNVPAFCKEVAQVSGMLEENKSKPVFVIHPGGAKMIDSVAQSVLGKEISGVCIQTARRSLKDGGNLASCSVLKIIAERWDEEGGMFKNDSKNSVVVAMGPGFVMCGVGFRCWEPKCFKELQKNPLGSRARSGRSCPIRSFRGRSMRSFDRLQCDHSRSGELVYNSGIEKGEKGQIFDSSIPDLWSGGGDTNTSGVSQVEDDEDSAQGP